MDMAMAVLERLVRHGFALARDGDVVEEALRLAEEMEIVADVRCFRGMWILEIAA